MIDKVGGVVLKDKKLLVVRKRTEQNYEEYIIPGGKREKGETDLETLQREMKEELMVDIQNTEYLGTYEDIAVFENVPITIHTYLVNVSGSIACDNEIKEYLWIDKDYKAKNIKLGSILDRYVIPELVKRQLM